jgi:hypothetical protein
MKPNQIISMSRNAMICKVCGKEEPITQPTSIPKLKDRLEEFRKHHQTCNNE